MEQILTIMGVINNNIEERRVSFPVAKLLKEKGFTIPCEYNYDEEGINVAWSSFQEKPENAIYSRPTQQLAIDWIRVNFGIHILINIAVDNKWYFELYDLRDKRNAEIFIDYEEITEYFNPPEEAKEAALEYCLTNLILKNESNK